MSGPEVGGASAPCPRRVFNARWDSTTVKCGDEARMLADTENIPADTEATFAVKQISDDSVINTVNSDTQATSVEGRWISRKPSANWNGAEVKFNVTAGGESAVSEGEQLSFHRYADIARASLTGTVSSPPGSATPNFSWDKKVHIEFTDRKMILTVKIRLINRTQTRPQKREKDSLEEYNTRCNNVPIGAAVPASVKQNMKNAIESIYRDQLYLHRVGCGRGNFCGCDLTFKCCKFKVEVIVEFVETSGAVISDVNLWPATGRMDSSNWHRIESPATPGSPAGTVWGHEVGHLMGFYDEYSTGAIGNPPWVPESAPSLMGYGHDVFPYHMEEFRTWFNGQVDEEFRMSEV
jgi:predicted small secreted protein